MILLAPSGITRPRPVETALALGGAAFSIVILIQGYRLGMFHFPGGDTVLYYDPAGDLVRAGLNPYVPLYEGTGFLYAPPAAMLLAAVSWLPPEFLHLGVGVASVVALRYVAGSWVGAGMLCWVPLVPFELSSGNINILVAAAIVAAVDGRGALPALMTFAKGSPMFALDRRGVASFVLAATLLVLLTAPVAWLWRDWISALLRALAQPPGPLVPVPLWVRLMIGIALVATRRPILRAIGAGIMIPAFYYGSLVIVIAPLGLWLRQLRARRMVAIQA